MRPWRGAFIGLVLLAPLFAPPSVAGCADGNANNDNTHGQVFDAAQPPYDGAQGNAGGGAGGGFGPGDDSGGTGDDGANPYDAWTGPGVDGGEDAGVDAPEDTGSPLLDAGEDGALATPTCDGIVQPGEYGANEATSSTQTWYMSWDDTNLYLAITSANVLEGNIVYFAISGTDAGAGLTTGNPYDSTLVSSLPIAANFVLYAKSSYNEVRSLAEGDAGLGWNALDANAITVCVGTSSSTREEVIPWKALGGRPTGFQWLGYVAANPTTNPGGYIYGQVPADANAGGADAGHETFVKYFAVPNATPGADPFVEQ
jgi:hypothetical protein